MSESVTVCPADERSDRNVISTRTALPAAVATSRNTSEETTTLDPVRSLAAPSELSSTSRAPEGETSNFTVRAAPSASVESSVSYPGSEANTLAGSMLAASRISRIMRSMDT